ncbi:M48 family metalloprotease [Cecembia calidifontis]|jgi:predicted Zn-dependent protease|uniref:Putative Zn-dependent protease n=1 Tax=Cecembia calidifontis TaxID=1187080 RepID=A0A4Q7P8L4_9BACT|nr:M48 family metalloprotease [Cecembia calidifontis]RZS96526.1 putative Zn-dependent protease [Cecembia calidifontis]
MNPSKKLLLICFIAIISFNYSCAVNPVTGKKQMVFMSEAQEIAMGKEADPEIIAYFGLYNDPELQQFITEKGLEMAAISHRPNLAYEFKIVDSPVLNAFALPGGYVYFTRGIMAHFNNEAEFAGVLGHEIGHITARHSVIQQRNMLLGQIGIVAGIVLVPELGQFIEPLSQGMQLALLSFGRDAERQSDKLGVEYSTKIGYDATEMAGFFETLKRQSEGSGAEKIPDFLSTHPSPEEREVTVSKLAEQWKEKLQVSDAAINRESYLKRIDGIIYGEDPKQGFVENGIFYHPTLKFSYPLPKDWSFQNTPQQVQSASKEGDAILILTLNPQKTLEEAAKAFIEQYKLELKEQSNNPINNIPAITLIADQKQEKSSVRLMASFIHYNGLIYQLMGLAEASKFQGKQNIFLESIMGFKELKDVDKLNRTADVIRIKSVPQQMTVQEAFEYFKMPKARFNELAILNGWLLTDNLNKGELIKVIGK